MVPSIGKPPPAIDYSRLLYYAVLGKSIRYSGRKLMFVGRAGEELKELKKVPGVAICEGEIENNKTVWLFYCDKHWNTVGSAPYDAVEAAMHRAERMYPGIGALWVKANITKKQSKDYLRELWKHSRCHFCNHVKPGPAGISHIIKTEEGLGICNCCIDTFYHSIHNKKGSARIRK
jgi:hypothetical protein